MSIFGIEIETNGNILLENKYNYLFIMFIYYLSLNARKKIFLFKLITMVK